MPSKARSVARAGCLAFPLLAAALATGCGQEDPAKPVRLSLVSPPDGVVVHENSVEVRGRVRPAYARVLVGGHAATVTNGEFRGRVPLREGANVIDVGASADDARTAWSALRVARETLVRVPELAGAPRDDAVEELESLGLSAAVEQGDGLLDRLLPGAGSVCDTQPRAGTRLRKGSTVRLAVSNGC